MTEQIDGKKSAARELKVDANNEGRVSSRREVLTGGAAVVVGTSLAAGMASSAKAESGSGGPGGECYVNSRAKKTFGDAHVVVVGGGFAGMTCARDLSRRGYNVTVLEARNRIGGRTFTAEFNGEPTDMGGTWVHWMQPHVWSEIRRYGVELEETKGAVAERIIYVDYSGKRHETTATAIWDELEKAMARYFPNAYATFPRPSEPFADTTWMQADNKSVAQALSELDASEATKAILDGYMTCMGSSRPENHAWTYVFKWYAHCGYNMTVMNDATARFKMKGGTKALITQIAAEAAADLRLSTPVSSVTQVGEKVEVVTDFGDKFVADAVVMAVPWNVLSDIQFSPPLPAEKAKIVNEGHVGNGVKIHVLVEGELDVMAGYAPGGDAKISFVMWDKVKDGHTHFIGFGPSRDNLDVNDLADVEAAMRVWLPDAKVVQAYGYEWGIDPYSQGVWMVPRVGQFGRAVGPLQASHGRIHFASADWANSWPGFIDGAIEQGIVSAEKVQAQLTPNDEGGLITTKVLNGSEAGPAYP